MKSTDMNHFSSICHSTSNANFTRLQFQKVTQTSFVQASYKPVENMQMVFGPLYSLRLELNRVLCVSSKKFTRVLIAKEKNTVIFLNKALATRTSV